MHLRQRVAFLLFSVIIITIPFHYAFAAPPSSPYLPGETLAPSCAPGDANCTVTSPAQSGDNADITSLGALQAATTSRLVVTSQASTSNLVVSNSFTLGTLTGFLKAVNGAVSTALINLTSDVTGVLPIANGGVGTSTAPSLGQLLVGNSLGGYSLTATSSLGLLTTNVTEGSNLYYTDARVENALTNILQAGSGVNFSHDSSGHTITIFATGGGGGGTDVNWSYFGGLIHPATSSNQVVIGGTSTSSASKLTVLGGATIDSATTTNFSTGNFVLGSLTGFLKATNGIVSSAVPNLASDVTGILPVANGGTGTSSALAAGQIAVGNGAGGYNYVSTSSLGLTTSNVGEGSNLYYTNARVQSYLDGLSRGYFFGTTSAQYFLSQNQSNAFSTTSASYFLTQNNLFSTTSAQYFLAQNQTGAFSTSSNNYWLSTKTTDTLSQGSSNKYYSTNLLAADLSATTTDTLREGASNLYWTNTRFDSRLAATTSLLNITNLANLASVGTITSGVWNGSAIPISSGGTGASSPSAARSNLGAASSGANSDITSLSGLTSAVSVSQGGTGSTTLSGLLKGNGTGAIRSAIGGTDYEFPITFNTPLSRVGNTVSLSTSGDWTGTLGGYSATQLLAGSFSTTSAQYFLAQNQTGSFATTSADYWISTKTSLANITSLPSLTRLSGLTSNGFLTTSGGNGTLGVDTTSYTPQIRTLTAGAGLVGGGDLSADRAFAIDFTRSNTWTGLQQFAGGASSSQLSVFQKAYFGATATSSFDSTGALTLSNAGANLVLTVNSAGTVVGSSSPTVASITATSTTATSTFAGGLFVGTSTPRFVVDRTSGNIGIGAYATSTSLLNVAGKVTASGGYSGICPGSQQLAVTSVSLIGLNVVNCSDVAETYPTYEQTEAGDVVSIPNPSAQSMDGGGIVQIGRSRGASGERVLGVVSTSPGLVFQNGTTYLSQSNVFITPNSTIVALAGRVPVKVSLANGPIAAGDPLAPSTTTPGVAVRATAPGDIVGIALQPYASDNPQATTTPQIMMFVDTGFSLGVDDQSDSPLDQFTRAIATALQKLGVAIQDGIATLKELHAQKVQTQVLCVGDTCVTSDQLKALLSQLSSTTQPVTQSVAPPAAPTPDISSSSDADTVEASSTDTSQQSTSQDSASPSPDNE